ncbi:MAG: single-stranded DNA-binding protein [Lentisphaeria bacterium]
MNDLNKVLLSGNLVRDPEFRDVAGGLQVCGLRIAVNRRYADRQGAKKEEVSFIDVEYFVGGSDDAAQTGRLHKGAPVFIEGRLKLDQWDDKQSGQRRFKVKVVGERVLPLAGVPRDREASPELLPAAARPGEAPPPPPAADSATPPRPAVTAGRVEAFSGRRRVA